jgi:two-component system, chemotaxis family, sensor kinase CheA
VGNDDLTSRLRATFLDELAEQVRVLNAGLLQLEGGAHDEERLRTLFRSAHTIKGAARVAGFPLVERACHALEAVFAEVRDGDRSLSGADFSLLFAVCDALDDAGARLRRRDDIADGPLAALLPRLDELAGPPRPAHRARPAAAPTPSPTPAPAPSPDETPAPSPDETPAPSAARAPVAAPGAPTTSGEELARVRSSRLDELLDTVGELVVASGRIVERSGRRDDAARRLDQATAAVAAAVHGLRLRPLAEALEGLPRAVRDVAAEAGKQVTLELSGQEVEADRIVVDSLREPLLHLVRNAVDHGIEPPAERERRGKPATGSVRVGAELAGGRVVVTVSDDGGGIDEDAVRATLRERGEPVPEGRAALADALLAGGFSTRREATTISGRGVGVDLVRAAVQRIGGTVDVDWRAGAGTTFTLACPPTPAMIRALLVRVGAVTFGIPTAHVERLRRIGADDVRTVEGRTLLTTPQGPIPVHVLAALLGPPLDANPVEDRAPAVILAVGHRRAALVVDEVIAEDELVVRPLRLDPGTLPYAAGAAVLPSGTVALVLNAAVLSGARPATAGTAGTAIAPVFAQPTAAPRRRILVADDSITTRTLEQSMLEAAGYDVATAVDGLDAWERLERDGADLLVADIEMPRMDGFTLCRRIRATPRFAELPVVLVTGLGSDEDRARGMDAGADAYIVKSSFDQAALLDTVRQLVGD